MNLHFQMLAKYNKIMNDRIYRVAANLPALELHKNRGAAFQSIFLTLNHIAVVDIIWLQRFSKLPKHETILSELCVLPTPNTLSEPLFGSFNDLKSFREWLDKQISTWTESLQHSDLGVTLNYVNSQGAQTKHISLLIMHFFNHQTHHRGQVSTLLSQMDIDIGVTDLLQVIPNVTKQ